MSSCSIAIGIAFGMLLLVCILMYNCRQNAEHYKNDGDEAQFTMAYVDVRWHIDTSKDTKPTSWTSRLEWDEFVKHAEKCSPYKFCKKIHYQTHIKHTSKEHTDKVKKQLRKKYNDKNLKFPSVIVMKESKKGKITILKHIPASAIKRTRGKVLKEGRNMLIAMIKKKHQHQKSKSKKSKI